MISKEGKARWVYRCAPCRIRATYPDQFRALECQLWHERSIAHDHNVMAQIMQAAAQPFAEVMNNLGLAWGNLAETVTKAAQAMQNSFALVPPQNVPHDPALLRDRRKWGGR